MDQQGRQVNRVAEGLLVVEKPSGILRYLDFSRYWIWHLSLLCVAVSFYQPYFLSCLPFIIFLRLLPANGVFDYGALFGSLLFFLLALSFHFRIIDVVPTSIKDHNVFLFNRYIDGDLLVTYLLLLFISSLLVINTYEYFRLKDRNTITAISILNVYRIKTKNNTKAYIMLVGCWLMVVTASYAAFSKPIKTSLKGYIEFFSYRDGFDEERHAALILTVCFAFLFVLIKGTWLPLLHSITQRVNSKTRS